MTGRCLIYSKNHSSYFC